MILRTILLVTILGAAAVSFSAFAQDAKAHDKKAGNEKKEIEKRELERVEKNTINVYEEKILELEESLKKSETARKVAEMEAKASAIQSDIARDLERNTRDDLAISRREGRERERRFDRFLYSLIFPGLGHYLNGQDGRGLLWGGGFLLLLGADFYQYSLVRGYGGEMDAATAALDSQSYESARSRYESGARRLNLLYALTALVYLANVIDALTWEQPESNSGAFFLICAKYAQNKHELSEERFNIRAGYSFVF